HTIELGTLRSASREPRIHFALVCAARSCPALRSEAYRGAELDRQLDEQARQFLHDPRKNRVDTATRTLRLSPIFKWSSGWFSSVASPEPSSPARCSPPCGGTASSVERTTSPWRCRSGMPSAASGASSRAAATAALRTPSHSTQPPAPGSPTPPAWG